MAIIVKLNENQEIIDFVEKPQTFVSDLAMIGIYYFKDGAALRRECEYLIDNDIQKGGEFQLPDALRRLTEQGVKFKPGKVDEWLDCGNKEVTVYTNQRVLEFDKENDLLVNASIDSIKNSVIIQPCFIDKSVTIENSIVGPHVSIGKGTIIVNSIVKNSIIQTDSKIENSNIADSMIGSSASLIGKAKDVSLGDFSAVIEWNI